MKKNINIFICIALVVNAITTLAQNPVPNPGFENWSGGNPISWSTNNVPTAYTPVTQTTSAHGGLLAAQGDVVQSSSITLAPFLSSTDMSGNGFPVSQLYTTFSFYYKFTPVGGVIFVPSAAIYQTNGTLVSAAGQNINVAASSYTYMAIPFYTFGLNPAKCTIAFTLSDTSGAFPALGNSFSVDDVELSNTISVEEPEVHGISKIQPNPASGSAYIYYSLPDNDNIVFQITDVTGAVRQEIKVPGEIAGKHKLELNIAELPEGFYMVNMITGTNATAFPLVKTH